MKQNLDEGRILTTYMSAAIELSALADKYFPGSWNMFIRETESFTIIQMELNVNGEENDSENILSSCLVIPDDPTESELKVKWAITELEHIINSSAYLLVRSGECREAKS